MATSPEIYLNGAAMRILFVTPYVPSPIRVRPYQLIKNLSASHEVSLVALLCDEYEREMVYDVANFCASLDLVALPRWLAYAHCLRALPTSMPLRVAYYQSSDFARRLLEVVRQRKIDVVHGELVKVIPALHALCSQVSIPVVYDSVDCISSFLHQQHTTAHNIFQKAFVSSEWKKMQRYESRSLHQFDQVIITSARDRELLLSLRPPAQHGEALEHIHVVPNGVDTDYFSPSAAAREVDSLVFCAKMDYYPNAQAILAFCRDILPRIWERRPQVQLTVVGNNPPPAVRALSEDQRITVTGYVPDIRPYLGSASVALAPLLVAAGMQNKVLEALAMGTPLVATPASCRSLQVKDGAHLLIAEDAALFASAVVCLLEDQQLAAQLRVAGRKYVEEHHSWQHSTDLLCSIYRAATKTELQDTSERGTALVF